MSSIIIKNYGAYAPDNIVTNDMLSKIVDTNDDWIVKRTGIRERRISTGENTSELAINAVKNILTKERLKGEEIDLIIAATITADNATPSVACMVQKEIGADRAMAFDLGAACSGFIYSLQVAYSMMQCNEKLKKVLVIGSEVISKIIDWNDRSTCVLFGDGSGAVLLERTKKKKLIDFYSYSVGKKGEALACSSFDIDNPFICKKVIRNKYITMNGREVFKFAVKAMIESINYLLNENNLDINKIDYIVPHQANERIIEYVADKLKISKDKFYINLDKYGNTSSASIPIALNEMSEKQLLKEDMKIIMIGFGAGLTLGSLIIEL